MMSEKDLYSSIEVKSKFDAEFRRFSVSPAQVCESDTFLNFQRRVARLHHLEGIHFTLAYTDKDGDLLPINNDENCKKALKSAKPLLRLFVQKKGDRELNGYGTLQKKKNIISNILTANSPKSRAQSATSQVKIGLPEDFRRVSAIIDVHIVPETHRRVKLLKHGSDKPLGFYIRDGTSVRVTPQGLEKGPGIFISRLVPGGLAESTGLLAVNDEVLEVNGIEVAGKTLDQVTDMMVANSSNLIITVKPVNQRNTLSRPNLRNTSARSSQHSQGSAAHDTPPSHDDTGLEQSDDDEDVVKDYLTTQDTHNHQQPSRPTPPPPLANNSVTHETLPQTVPQTVPGVTENGGQKAAIYTL